jgi:hypothetical protein
MDKAKWRHDMMTLEPAEAWEALKAWIRQNPLHGWGNASAAAKASTTASKRCAGVHWRAEASCLRNSERSVGKGIAK